MDCSPCDGTEPPRLEDLISRARGGDRPALTELIRCYQTRMARFVIGETGNDGQYEDLCQTIFVKMVISLPKLRAADRFEPWLFQIARNVCRDHLRASQGRKRMFVSLGPDSESIAAELPAARDDGEGNFRQSLAQLPPEQRRLIELSLEEKRSNEELAAMTRSTVSSVKSRLFRARENLRGILLFGERK